MALPAARHNRQLWDMHCLYWYNKDKVWPRTNYKLLDKVFVVQSRSVYVEKCSHLHISRYTCQLYRKIESDPMCLELLFSINVWWFLSLNSVEIEIHGVKCVNQQSLEKGELTRSEKLMPCSNCFSSGHLSTSLIGTMLSDVLFMPKTWFRCYPNSQCQESCHVCI